MFELALVLGLLALFIGSAAALAYAAWWVLFGAGLVLIGLGLVVGVPAGLYYHVLLYRFLQPRAQLTPRWWLAPNRLHQRLQARELKIVRRWFIAGAAGFVASVLGCAVAALGALKGD
jgi:hypothetical protein